MLIQFNFKNVKSFRDEAILDMTALDSSESSDSLVKVGNEKVLPVAAIYGANASGKSNVYQAFLNMSKYVVNSFKFGDDEDEFERNRVSPFLFDSVSFNAESSFEVYFTMVSDSSEECYNYGFCVSREGITEEWLNIKKEMEEEYCPVFYRSVKEDELDLSGLPEDRIENVRVSLEKEVLIVSLGAKLKIDICKKVRDWFLGNEFTNFGDPITDALLSRNVPVNFVSSKSVQDNLAEYLNTFDDHIKGFHVEKLPKEDEDTDDRYKIDTLHQKIDSEEKVQLPLRQESAGTQKMFALYPFLQSVLEKGSVFFVDELNARLHPLLVRNFLQMFLNPEINQHHAQLVFTVHDTWLLSIPLLRRDEVWFVEKNEEGISSLYSLADFTDEENWKSEIVQNDEEKYLLGEYGAIPRLKKMDVLREGKKDGEK